jgi:hypothetical protein
MERLFGKSRDDVQRVAFAYAGFVARRRRRAVCCRRWPSPHFHARVIDQPVREAKTRRALDVKFAGVGYALVARNALSGRGFCGADYRRRDGDCSIDHNRPPALCGNSLSSDNHKMPSNF